ncbi:site-specific integrase [Clostridium botulinum]|uniref:tyrosine-type recombinase/integrase n=1 Tax=Clostridium botulinum TaxID=1491 RepID=UPI000A170EEB|nr:site-specific integrase [Clostridium botulinum]AUN16101.1 site-specific integrase [Clostridium botulinum]AUN16122.1 site-specific integrase [Clostridium botulinum]MBN3399577.1 site-specific integrase [Clostridium botulinum]OSA82897.1 site-specific integrase [Clostridium botulinum]
MAKTIYKKKIKNGKEYYFYRLRHKNLSKPKDIYGATVKELDTKIKTIINDLDNNISNNKEFFGVFFKDWLYNTHMTNKKPSTKERYNSIFKNYIEDSPIYELKLKNLTPSDIQNYYNDLIAKGKSVAAIKHLHKLIAPSIRYACDSNRILKDFSRAIVIPKDKEDKKLKKVSAVKPFSLKEQLHFIEIIKGHELEMLFLTALDSGLRQGELFALTWNDIDFNNKCITVNKSFKSIKNIKTNKYENIIQTPKTDKSIRVVPIPSRLTDKLKQHKLSQKTQRLKMANLYENNNLVFCNKFGKYLDSGNVLKKFKKILKDNKLEVRKFHDLRHTYATRLFELGEEPKTVQTLLGHSNISITLDTYTHVLDNLKEKAVSKLDNLYINAGAK